MRKRSSETRPMDRMIAAYVDWRETCLVVHDAYRSWASETRPAADIAFRRPGTGFAPKDADRLIARELTRDVSKGHVFSPEDLS